MQILSYHTAIVDCVAPQAGALATRAFPSNQAVCANGGNSALVGRHLR